MLKKVLCAYAVMAMTVMSLCATEKEEENTKVLPGVLVCNCEEDKCTKNDNESEEIVQPLSGAFASEELEEKAIEEQVLACKHCK